jgi:hypothetical protein
MKWSQEVFVSGFVLAVAGFAASCPALRAQTLDSNGLWLKIALTNNAAVFTIHAPATNANGVFDLYFKTNLTDNQDWTWLLRCAAGQTNLTVSNPPPAQGFFTLGVTNAIRSGFDGNSLPAEDDSPSGFATLPFAISLFGGSSTTLYVNNNGNVTLDNAQSSYTPTALINLGIRIIAPYWADVDTRNTNSDVVTYGSGMVGTNNAFGVNWVNVGYFADHADKLLSCQLVIINRSDIASGDFDMEFNYFKVQWEWGDASKNWPPRAGFSDGTEAYELPGSGVEGAFLDTNAVTGLIYNSTNSPVPGRYVFYFRDGTNMVTGFDIPQP